MHGPDIWKWAIVYAFVFSLVGLREKFRARGYGLFTLSAGIGFWPAAILSAAFFGYSHHGNSGEDWIGLFNVWTAGLPLVAADRHSLDADRTSHGLRLGRDVLLWCGQQWPDAARSSSEFEFVRPGLAVRRYCRS